MHVSCLRDETTHRQSSKRAEQTSKESDLSRPGQASPQQIRQQTTKRVVDTNIGSSISANPGILSSKWPDLSRPGQRDTQQIDKQRFAGGVAGNRHLLGSYFAGGPEFAGEKSEKARERQSSKLGISRSSKYLGDIDRPLTGHSALIRKLEQIKRVGRKNAQQIISKSTEVAVF